MATESELFAQHMHDLESRMQQIDKLMERARHGLSKGNAPEGAHAELEEASHTHKKLVTLYEELKLESTEDWRREEIIKSGPMGIWDALAQQLEKLVEKMET